MVFYHHLATPMHGKFDICWKWFLSLSSYCSSLTHKAWICASLTLRDGECASFEDRDIRPYVSDDENDMYSSIDHEDVGEVYTEGALSYFLLVPFCFSCRSCILLTCCDLTLTFTWSSLPPWNPAAVCIGMVGECCVLCLQQWGLRRYTVAVWWQIDKLWECHACRLCRYDVNASDDTCLDSSIMFLKPARMGILFYFSEYMMFYCRLGGMWSLSFHPTYPFITLSLFSLFHRASFSATNGPRLVLWEL